MEEELKKKIEEWKKQYGNVYELQASWTVEGKEIRRTFILREPNTPLMEMLIAGIFTKPSKAYRNLIVGCLLDPSVDEFHQLADKYPGLPISLGGQLMEDTGITAEVVKKKL